MAIGKDLLDLPFAELVRNLAVAIAEGQAALDRNSIETLRALLSEEVPIVTDIIERIEPQVHPVEVTIPNKFDEFGQPVKETIVVTGARVNASGATPINMNLLQIGLMPTFYQFTEASIEVRLSITMREEKETTSSNPSKKSGFLGLGLTKAFASSVDYRTANKYNYQASGASILKATMKPVPPPSRVEPIITTVNMFTTPPTVNRTP